MFVNLSGATNATIADSQGILTILNDDLPQLTINSVSVTEGNYGIGHGNVHRHVDAVESRRR